MAEQKPQKTSPFLECLNKKAHPLEVSFYEDYESTDLDKVLSQKIQSDPKRYLYHYTNQQGAYGILESKTLWASDPIFLNDAQEIRLGISALDKAFKKIKNEKHKDCERVRRAHLWLTEIKDEQGKVSKELTLGRAYTVSFTTKADDLSQWRGYGGAAGVALGFELTLLEGALPKPFFAPIIYGDEETFTNLLYEDILYTLENLKHADSIDYTEALITRYATFLPLIKHKAFKDEDEWRMVVIGDYISSPSIEWRSASSYALPYIKIALWKGGKRTPLFLEEHLSPPQSDKKPCTRCCCCCAGLESENTSLPQPGAEPHQGCCVRLGPGANDLAELYFYSRLDKPTDRSAIPFRAQ